MPSNSRPRRRAHRYFRCSACNHKLRFGSAECGSCCSATPIYNRLTPYVLIGTLAVASVAVNVMAG